VVKACARIVRIHDADFDHGVLPPKNACRLTPGVAANSASDLPILQPQRRPFRNAR
jgi:hypothetical protein